MKNSSDTIGNGTRDFPACSTVPQPTAPPRARNEHTYVQINLFSHSPTYAHLTMPLVTPLTRRRMPVKWIGKDVYESHRAPRSDVASVPTRTALSQYTLLPGRILKPGLLELEAGAIFRRRPRSVPKS
jgi:hypothetical protein